MRFNAPNVNALKLELEREFDELSAPQEPTGVYACATADLPDVAKYRGCMVRDTTTNTFKYSNGTTWS